MSENLIFDGDRWREWDLPEDAISMAIQFEWNQASAQMEFGDFINDLAGEMRRSVLEVSKKLAHSSGGSADTYRDYARVSAAVNEAMREEYPLSYAQWRACLSGDDLFEVARWAVETYPVMHGGKPATVNAIYEHTLGKSGGSTSVTYRRYNALHNAAERFANDSRIPVGLRQLAAAFLSALEAEYAKEEGNGTE